MSFTRELWAIRLRTYGRLLAQLTGFALIAWGAYDLLLAKALLQNAPSLYTTIDPLIPSIVYSGRGMNSGFLEAVVIALGAIVVAISSR